MYQLRFFYEDISKLSTFLLLRPEFNILGKLDVGQYMYHAEDVQVHHVPRSSATMVLIHIEYIPLGILVLINDRKYANMFFVS